MRRAISSSAPEDDVLSDIFNNTSDGDDDDDDDDGELRNDDDDDDDFVVLIDLDSSVVGLVVKDGEKAWTSSVLVAKAQAKARYAVPNFIFVIYLFC